MRMRVSADAVGTPLGWVMWAIPAFLFLIGFFHRAAPGVIARDLMQAFDATGATVGLLAATYFYSYAGLMIPAGLVIDTFGPRRVLAMGGAVLAVKARRPRIPEDPPRHIIHHIEHAADDGFIGAKMERLRDRKACR